MEKSKFKIYVDMDIATDVASERKTVYFDMDGTLAEWKEVDTFSQLLRKGYFRTLRPTKLAVYANRLAAEGKADTNSCSSYITEGYSLSEKNEWMDESVPNIDDSHRIFIPYGVEKAKFVMDVLKRPLTKGDILVDDHTPNLIAWEKAGGTAIKWLNGINGLNGKFKGPRVSDIEELDELIFAT